MRFDRQEYALTKFNILNPHHWSPSKRMNIAPSITELPLDSQSTPQLSPLEGAMTSTRPLQLWAFLENSDFVRYKNGSLYRQDEVRLIRHDEFLDADYQLMLD